MKRIGLGVQRNSVREPLLALPRLCGLDSGQEPFLRY
jgi:hypothetical protein